jgi:hypothetical protein
VGFADLLRKNLPALAMLHGTDKWGLHWYARHYQHHFSPLRRKRFNLLEIGVGGHHAPDRGGASLRMWKSFFPRAHIYAIDIFDKSALQEPRITIFQGSQDDPDFLRRIAREIGTIDVIVDDGSHVNQHVMTAFETLFPLLADGGIYALEDLQTAYWPEFGGTEDTSTQTTSISMLKQLVDGLNWEEFSEREPRQLDSCITSLHFYHNLAFVYKGRNQEGTNKSASHIVHSTVQPLAANSLLVHSGNEAS